MSRRPPLAYASNHRSHGCKRAGLLLYALQTASYNLKRASLEPDMLEVVRDTSSLAQEVTLPPDPVDTIRAMRRTYWKLRDPELLNRDREIVARYCASPKPATAAAPPPAHPGSPAHSTAGSPDDIAPDDESDPVLKFISEMNRSHPRPTTR